MLDRRTTLMLLAGSVAAPKTALAKTPQEIMWDNLIPAGLPYPEIIGEGVIDEEIDFWDPIYDENATKLVEELNGAYIKMPVFIIPFEVNADGVTEFMLVPYMGACIHVPPPPANQLVMVKATEPWPSEQLWDAVWVTGTMRTQLQSTDLGDTGYFIAADAMEIYIWE